MQMNWLLIESKENNEKQSDVLKTLCKPEDTPLHLNPYMVFILKWGILQNIESFIL